MNDRISFYSGLSFAKPEIIPQDSSLGPVIEYVKDNVYPLPYKIIEEGVVEFKLYIPNATIVILKTYSDEFQLEKKGLYWQGVCKVGTGFTGVFIFANDIEIIYPALPIGFGGNRAMNFIQILEEENVITPTTINHGNVIMDYFESKVSKKLERIYVYLPPNYLYNSENYPVLYLQHGHGENETTWVNQGKMNFIMDNLLSEDKIVPFIVVMCNGMVSQAEKHRVTVSPAEKFEEMLVQEIIPYIDSKYRTIAQKKYRAMAGLSMGSMQASIISLKNQHLFDYAGIFSGFVSDFISGYTQHLDKKYLRTYSNNLKYIFRAMGEDDEFFDIFEKDDKLFEEYGIKHERRIYKGEHEWKVWQHCFYDFVQNLFK